MTVLFSLALPTILAHSGFAAPTKPLHCAVKTLNVINAKDATKRHLFADYKGRRYFFCCAACPSVFRSNPARFAKNDSVPIPKKRTRKH